MNVLEVFILADQALNRVVQQIRDDQWEMTMPASFQTGTLDHRPTLREIVAHHAYDDAWMPDMLAGRTMNEVGEDAYRGDILGDDPRGTFNRLVQQACAAAAQVPDEDRIIHWSYGDFALTDGLWHVIFFRSIRALDIARVIGVDSQMPHELVQALYEHLRLHADEWRAMGVFGAAVEVPEDAPLQDRLLGLTGRDPAGEV